MRVGAYRVLFLLAFLFSEDVLAGRRFALLVGANKGLESDVRLKHAEEDARRLKDILIEMGDMDAQDVALLESPDDAGLRAELKALKQRLTGASAQDVFLIFYYSGHADDKDLHLRGSSFSLKELHQSLQELPAKVKLGIIDACQSGSILVTKAGKSAKRFDVKVNGEMDDVQGTIFLTSSGADELSIEARGTGSVFTHHLLSGLRGAADTDHDQRMSLEEVYHYAYTQTVLSTSAMSARVQHPSFGKELKGRGGIYLTELKQTGAFLLFPRGTRRCFVTTRDERHIAAEVVERQDAEVRIALSPGEYLLKCVAGKRYKVASLQVEAGVSLRIDKLPFDEVPLSEGVLKGTSDEMAEALATRLMAQAELIRVQQPERLDLSVLLAMEAVRRNPSPEAHQVLIQGLGRLPLAKACFSHGAEVLGAAWSPDGEYLATAGADKEVRVWSLKTGQALSRTSLDKAVVDLVWSPDGTRITARARQGETFHWKFKPEQTKAPENSENPLYAVALDPAGVHVAFMDQRETLSLREQMDGLEVLRVGSMRPLVRFSADGRFLVAQDASGRLRVWDVSTRQEVLATQPIEPSARVSSLAISPDGGLLAVVQEGARTVQVWEVTSTRQFTLPAHDGAVTALAFASASTLLTASEDKTVRLWEGASGRELLRMQHEAAIESIFPSPDGQRLATTWGGGHSTSLWDLRTGQELTRLAHSGPVRAVAWSLRDDWLATASEDGTACVWGLPGQGGARMVGWGRHTAMAFAQGGHLLVTTTEDEPACLWEVATGHPLACLDGPGGANFLAVSPDGKFLATASGALARVWGASTGKEVSRLLHEGFIHALVFSPDGATLASASRDGTVRVWGVATGHERHRVKHEGPVRAVAFSPDGRLLATGGEDRTVRLVELATGKELLKLEHQALSCKEPSGAAEEVCKQPYMQGTPAALESVRFSPDGRYLATTTLDGVARLWETESGKEVLNQPLPTRSGVLAFTPDGRGLAVANGEPVARIWDVATGQELPPVEAQEGISFLQYSADGKYLLTTSEQGKVSIWDAGSRRELARTVQVTGAAPPLLSPDGRYLATVREYGNGSNLLYSIHSWRTDDLINQACTRLRRNLTQLEWAEYLGDAEPYQKRCPDLP